VKENNSMLLPSSGS